MLSRDSAVVRFGGAGLINAATSEMNEGEPNIDLFLDVVVFSCICVCFEPNKSQYGIAVDSVFNFISPTPKIDFRLIIQ